MLLRPYLFHKLLQLFLRVFIFGTSVLLPAHVASDVHVVSVTAEPRPVGVSNDASPEEKGREILRIVVELVKHGDLMDTEFATRLLRLPITPGKGFRGPNSPQFPQQLAESFGYFIRDVGPVHQSVEFHLNPTKVCLRFDEFLTIFNKEFGIGTDIVKDSRSPPNRIVPREQGWKELNSIHSTKLRSIYQSASNGLVVYGDFSECAWGIKVQRYRSYKP